MDKQILDDFTNSLRSSYEPYYLGFAMHPEEGREAKINDELVKSVALMQLKNGLRIDISLSRTCFHLDVQIQWSILFGLLQFWWHVGHQALFHIYDRLKQL